MPWKRPRARRLRASLCSVFLAWTVGCDNTFVPGNSEAWVADLTITGQILYMSITRKAQQVTGTGTLASLTGTGDADSLTRVGTRRADTLDVVFRRSNDEQFRFVGQYTTNGQGISGILTGSAFNQTNASFRRR